MLTLTLLQKIAVWTIPVLLAITLHEAAHAWAASRFGDNTARLLGRLSINPLRHIDLVGTIIVPILVGVLSQFQFVFGWAKPVPINWNQLRHPRQDMRWVAAAGPLSNFLMAFFWALLLKLSTFFHPETVLPALFLQLTSQAGILVNLMLAFVNLIPIPPLDGSRILSSILPPKHAAIYQKIEPLGFIILLGLLYTGLLGRLLGPILFWSLSAIQKILNL